MEAGLAVESHRAFRISLKWGSKVIISSFWTLVPSFYTGYRKEPPILTTLEVLVPVRPSLELVVRGVAPAGSSSSKQWVSYGRAPTCYAVFRARPTPYGGKLAQTDICHNMNVCGM